MSENRVSRYVHVEGAPISRPKVSAPSPRPRPSPVSGFRQTAGRFQQIRADRAKGQYTGRFARASKGIGGARSGLRKGGNALKSARDFAHRHRMTSKAKGGRTPGELAAATMHDARQNIPLIGTKARKKGIRNQ
jgi:hypothetical protein